MANENTDTKPLEGEALESAVVKQVEYYFSKENLANDHYLVSQMDPQLWVPIATIAQFKMVRTLTTDNAVLVKCMRASNAVDVDDNGVRVRPKFKARRNTLILRDIPAATPVDDVKALFKGLEEQPHTVRGDFGDNWFVQFEEEAATVAALEHLRSVKFAGASVKARIKSENLLKSFYRPPPSDQVYAAPAAPIYGQGAWVPDMYGYTGQQGFVPQGQQYGAGMEQKEGRNRKRRGKGKGGNANNQNIAGGNANNGARQGDAAGNVAGGNGGAAAGEGKKSKKKGKKSTSQQHPILVVPSESTPVFNNEEFPALPGGGAAGGSVRDRAMSVTGYQRQYRKYDRETILSVVKRTLETVTAPQNLFETPVTRTEADRQLEMHKPLPDPAELEALEELQRRRSQRLSSDGGGGGRRSTTGGSRRVSRRSTTGPSPTKGGVVSGASGADDDDIIVEVTGVQAEPRRPKPTAAAANGSSTSSSSGQKGSGSAAGPTPQPQPATSSGGGGGGRPTWAQMAANSKDKPAPPSTLGKTQKTSDKDGKEKEGGKEKKKSQS